MSQPRWWEVPLALVVIVPVSVAFAVAFVLSECWVGARCGWAWGKEWP